MLALPPPETLRCFVEAARLQSFRAAARVVGLTAAAVGQRIAQLETLVGQPLFDRSRRRTSLTAAGMALVPAALRSLDASAACLRVPTNGEEAALPIDLVIGTRHELGMSWIVPMLPTLRRALPDACLHLYFGSGDDLLLRVLGGEVHCAVGSMRVFDRRITSARLHPEPYVFVGGRKGLTRTPFRRFEDAGSQTLIDATPRLPLFAYWRDAPEGRDLAFKRVVHMGTIAAIRDQVRRDQGVAVLPEFFVADDLRRGRLVNILPRIQPLADYLRLFFRADDARRSLFERLAARMAAAPLPPTRQRSTSD